MASFLTRKNLTYIALGVVVLGAAAYFFLGNAAADEATVSVLDANVTGPEATFINLADELDPITFDSSVFSDPRFTSLVDIHTAIVPEASGRRDPFAPIPGVQVTK